jgi:hypothetical protein
VALGGWLYVQGRFPADFNATVDGTGEYLLISADHGISEDHGFSEYAEESLWALEIETRRLERVALGGGQIVDWAREAPRVAMYWPVPTRYRDYAWMADLDTGEVWRTEAAGWSVSLSPDGKWLATMERGFSIYSVRTPKDAALQAPASRSIALSSERAMGWSEDGRTVYTLSGAQAFATGEYNGGSERPPTLIVAADQFGDTDRRVVARVDQAWQYHGISSRGRFAAFWRRREQEKMYGLLVDLATGRQIEVEGTLVGMNVTHDGRYVWSRVWRPGFSKLIVTDVRSGQAVRNIGSNQPGGGRPIEAIASPFSPHVLIIFTARPDHEWWLADPDGTDLRRLPIQRGEDVIGWSAEGEIILLRGLEVEALDPDTGQRRLIRELPRRGAVKLSG